MDQETFTIIGTGKMGTGIGLLLKKAGKSVIAVADLDYANAQHAAAILGCSAHESLSEASRAASCILIMTSDDAIASVCQKIVAEGGLRTDSKVVHMSGAGGLDLLRSAFESGSETFCIHPIQSVTDVQSALANIPGSTFGITTEKRSEPWAIRFVRDIGGTPLLVSEQDRPLYHAAACIASNYLVTLIHLAQTIYTKFGLTPDEALRAFWPLVMGTISNIEAKGTVASLTGPIARGDSGTILKHLKALSADNPSHLQFYRILGRLTADLAVQKGTLSIDQATAIKKILEGGHYE